MMWKVVLLLVLLTSSLAFIDSFDITFNSLDVYTEGNWVFEETNYLFIKALDKEGNNTSLTNISIEILDNINYTNGDTLVDTNKGYKKSFVIPSQDISEVNLKITAIQNVKSIEETIQIPIAKKSIFNALGNFLSKFFLSLGGIISQNIIHVAGVCLVFLAGWGVWLSRKKSNTYTVE